MTNGNIVPLSDGERRRERIVTYVSAFYSEHGYAPSITLIGAAVGLSSTSTTHAHLQRLVASGRLRKADGNRGFLPVAS